MGYHNILERAFCRLHGLSKKDANSGALRLGGQESSESVVASDLLEAIENKEVYQKTMRIKSFKAHQWLVSPNAVHDVLLCVAVLAPLEHCMYKFMTWLSEDAFVWKETSPVIEMGSDRSPAFAAVRHLSHIMQNDGAIPSMTSSLADLSAGRL